MKWDDIIKKGLYIYVHRDEYTYCLGGNGELAESQRIKNLYEYYYNNGYKDTMGKPYSEWLKENKGKKCFDCSGFLNYICGITEHSRSSWTYGGMSPNASLVDGVAGSTVWKRGHVGLDIGYGYFLHFPNFNRTCELGKILEYDWTRSVLIDDIDYNGANNR